MNELQNFFTNSILKWESENRQDIVWRKDITPYKVLVSELFLQRTNSRQVKNVFIDFIKKYPSILELSKAKREDVLDIIKPLGLLKRSESLINISQDLISNYDKNVPDNYNDLIKLKNIGRYTANTILCFAFKKKVPIVDVNVVRIFSRFFNFKSNKKSIVNDEKIWKLATDLLPDNNCDRYNFGLLDFTHEVCKNKIFNCNKCILNKGCYHFKNDRKR